MKPRGQSIRSRIHSCVSQLTDGLREVCTLDWGGKAPMQTSPFTSNQCLNVTYSLFMELPLCYNTVYSVSFIY